MPIEFLNTVFCFDIPLLHLVLDLYIQKLVESIHRETQLVDQTGQSVHEELGMFVLVITSHGAEGSVAGSDHKHIKLTDIYQLLSSKNFPDMRGKPKLIIIQACAGGWC